MSQALQQGKHFRDKQNNLNVQVIQRQKKTYISPIKVNNNDDSSLEKMNKSSLEKKNNLGGEQYGNLLKEQMTMSKIQDDNMLSKSRKVDALNANYQRENYPFGFEGVRVCEGVIEKYKASNYTIQKDMLQKFEKEAEEFRKNRIKKYIRQPLPQQRRIYQERRTQPMRETNNYSLLALEEEQKRRQALLEMQMIRMKEQEQQQLRRKKEQERERRRQRRNEDYLKREKENLVKVGNMLREIDHRLKENSSKLSSDLQSLKNQLKSTPKLSKVDDQRLFNIANRVCESSKSCSKIPVIMYSNTIADSRLHYNDCSQFAPRLHRKDFEDSSQNMKEVLNILKRNDKRLKLLTEGDDNCDISNYSTIS